MAKKKLVPAKPTEFGDYLLVNAEKLDRAINGVVGHGGVMMGGVGKDADEQTILAEYDRLGGLILKKNGGVAYDEDEEGNETEKPVDVKVATGSFYDFKARRPRTKPEVKIARNPNRKGVAYATTENVGDAGGDIEKEGARPGKGRVGGKRKLKSPADEKDREGEED